MIFYKTKCNVHKYALQAAVIMIFFSSCKKLIEVNPPINQIIGGEMYSSNANAASVLTGIYVDMSNDGIFTGSRSISLVTGLSSDELISTTESFNILNIVYTNNLTNNGGELIFWADLYAYIYRANSAIEGISSSSAISAKVKQQLIAEAKFVRAFMYFYLVNLYGDVPLLTTTDVKLNSAPPRMANSLVYEQIITDLKDAQNTISDQYVSGDVISPTTERTRPNKMCITALLSRVYLYTKKWDLAEQEASKIINEKTLYELERLDNVFKLSSKEAIWQLQPVIPQLNTFDAITFVLAAGPNGTPAPGPNGQQYDRPVYLSASIFDEFETDDDRRNAWTDSVNVSGATYPYAFKYKEWLYGQARTEYLMVFRLAEQYLIRGEARAQMGRVYGSNSAEDDLNVIRTRAGLKSLGAFDKEKMLSLIYKERKFELFTEWGHRWFDLKRTDRIDNIMNIVAPQKGGSWASFKAIYPIPVQEIQRNPSLHGHQNPGYPEQ
ncbi:RagB/SusD family nutrient uptake outer membrane protein [Chitinophaga agri]|uniref:RagB/SusD family nutrient uptake outer membrane protein n=1 Tax=Chitinophaga agri TaxID=2703787 RepID=A0A6B9ZFH9_9BACT|nr:RagB/SusD family nutrient uptake outer membrane protein [Chitinophaga agri]QHS61138.1 RagB/SusD family nutrient uptake outer membrane protein [Chitinophaga agri]